MTKRFIVIPNGCIPFTTDWFDDESSLPTIDIGKPPIIELVVIDTICHKFWRNFGDNAREWIEMPEDEL